MKQFDLVQDKDGNIGIITEFKNEHNVFVRYLSCNGAGMYCINKDCAEYDSLTHPTTANVWLRYCFTQIILRITSYIRKRWRYLETRRL